MLLLRLALIVSIVRLESHALKILSVVEKSCKVSTDEGDLDLSPISKTDGTPKFNLTRDNQYGAFLLWNPCKDFSFGNCRNTEACQQYNYGADNIGGKNVSKFKVLDNKLHLTYPDSYNPSYDQMQIEMVCGTANEKDVLVKGPQDSLTGCKLTSVHACIVKATPPKHKSTLLSAGSIMCIVLLVVVCVYIVAGVIIMKVVKKASGKELCPNYALWTGLPSNIMAGAKFLFSCGKTAPEPGVSYDKI